jgi:hypothetical protein
MIRRNSCFEAIFIITDALDDFIGATEWAEELWIANTLADIIHDLCFEQTAAGSARLNGLIARYNNMMKSLSLILLMRLIRFIKPGEKEKIIVLVDRALAPYGGRLFDGFSSWKNGRKYSLSSDGI